MWLSGEDSRMHRFVGSVWRRMWWHALTGLLFLAGGFALLPLASRASPETLGLPANPACVGCSRRMFR